MKTNVIRLPKEFKNGQGMFRQLERTDTKALYERRIGYNLEVACYEWFKVRKTPSLKVVDGKFTKDTENLKEYYPSTEEFGTRAWWSRTYEFAKAAYDSMT